MKILILGAGVIGISTAYELAKSGYKVTVVDRQSEPAQETSYANAGLISPGHAFAWANPQVPKVLFKSLFRNDQAFRFRFSLDPQFWKWGWKFLKECIGDRSTQNTLAKFRLCDYSQQILKEIASETEITFDLNQRGLLFIHRSKRSLEQIAKKIEALGDEFASQKILSPHQIIKMEPSLSHVENKISGGIFSPHDDSGDCYEYTQKLAKRCEEIDVKFLYDTTIKSISASNGKIESVETDQGQLHSDIYILSLGSYSPLFVKPLGIDLPIYPVKGYSLTIPVTNNDECPEHSGIDEDNLLAFSRMEAKLRFTATAEITGYKTTHKKSDFLYMLNLARDLFPHAGDYNQIEYWSGLRPMTPKGTPLLGQTKYPNLILNTGHGHLGWTMASGSARLIRQLISGEPSDLTSVLV